MRGQRGFTLIELLIVVAIIGIVAAIAIPNMMDAIERSRQKRSVGDIRTMVIAMQSFTVDFAGYPAPRHTGDPFLRWPLVQDTNNRNVIIPDLLQSVPSADAWHNAYNFEAGPPSTQQNLVLGDVVSGHFVVYSMGSDKNPGGGTDGSGPGPALGNSWCQEPPIVLGTLETHCYQSDIVWGDSHFEQSPDGRQKNC